MSIDDRPLGHRIYVDLVPVSHSVGGVCTTCWKRILPGPYFRKRCVRHILSHGDDRGTVEKICHDR